MTKKQLKEYKQANQLRKARILHLAKHGEKRSRHYWSTFAHIQDGKFTALLLQ